jgi:hypothetical protein
MFKIISITAFKESDRVGKIGLKCSVGSCSATVCLDSSFYSLADHADHEGVLAALHAEGNAAADACEDEEGETPDPGHASWCLFGEVLSLSHAEWAHQS